MTNKLRSKEKGFTIIEVMIVLAVAGLIMLIVFLAVPALQRGQRNTSRKADASRIATAAANFASNNNGSPPVNITDAGTLLSDAGNLAQYSLTGAGAAAGSTTPTACAAGTGANGKLSICGYAAVTLTAMTAGQDAMVLATGAQCGSGAGAMSAGSTKQMALFYTIETSGAPSWVCQNL